MSSVRRSIRHVTGLAAARIQWRTTPLNTESRLPYVPNRPTVNPVLPVHDMAAAIGFYRALGFEVVTYDAGYAWVRTCGWELFHLALVGKLEPGMSSAAAYIHVDDADGWHRAIVANAPDIDVGTVAEQPWGMREFAVADPSGNVIRIGCNV